jgi:polyisoprenoid-binding protein YceI
MATQTQITRKIDGKELPIPGVWFIDPVHSEVEFSVRHMMVSKVRGRFREMSGVIVIDEVPGRSSVQASVVVASIDTGDETRDEHLRSADFLDTEHFPLARFESAWVGPAEPFYPLDIDKWRLEGNLTIRDVTRLVSLEVELGGVAVDPWGKVRAGFRAWTEIDREDFGITWNQTLETGGILVGKTVKLEIEVEAVRQAGD